MRMDGASEVHSDGKGVGDPSYLQAQEQELNQCRVNPYFLVCSTYCSKILQRCETKDMINI